MATTIKFGTDGWRAIIADDFTLENLKRVADATAHWIGTLENPKNRVVVGYDCRFGGELFAQTTARVLAFHKIEVIISKGFVSTPMISFAAKQKNTDCGVIITASHNPPSYNGYKLKGSYGGPSLPEHIAKVEGLIQDTFMHTLESFEFYEKSGLIKTEDFETEYVNHALKSFDIEGIRRSNITIAYDAMYGAGQNAVERLLPMASTLHSEFNPSFKGTAPEPIAKNLKPFINFIQNKRDIDFAFATDGDADRIGIFDGEGNFIDSHHIILLLIMYLHKHKGLGGKVVTSFSCTGKIKKLCELYGLQHITTKIGFKYICGYMVEDDVLVGGEESGGIAVKNHIPERDGVWIALTIMEFMMATGKKLKDLIADLYAEVGSFAVERYDLHITEEIKQTIVTKCKENSYSSFGKYQVVSIEYLDGYKFYLDTGSWVMIRPSGTEPVLRVYAESPNLDECVNILEATKAAILH